MICLCKPINRKPENDNTVFPTPFVCQKGGQVIVHPVHPLPMSLHSIYNAMGWNNLEVCFSTIGIPWLTVSITLVSPQRMKDSDLLKCNNPYQNIAAK